MLLGGSDGGALFRMDPETVSGPVDTPVGA